MQAIFYIMLLAKETYGGSVSRELLIFWSYLVALNFCDYDSPKKVPPTPKKNRAKNFLY